MKICCYFEKVNTSKNKFPHHFLRKLYFSFFPIFIHTSIKLATFTAQINFKFRLNSQLPSIQTSNISNKLFIHPLGKPTSAISTEESRHAEDSPLTALDYKNKSPELENDRYKCKDRPQSCLSSCNETVGQCFHSVIYIAKNIITVV